MAPNASDVNRNKIARRDAEDGILNICFAEGATREDARNAIEPLLISLLSEGVRYCLKCKTWHLPRRRCEITEPTLPIDIETAAEEIYLNIWIPLVARVGARMMKIRFPLVDSDPKEVLAKVDSDPKKLFAQLVNILRRVQPKKEEENDGKEA